MNILITGATGFVGVNAVKYLSKDNNVVALVRDTEKADRLFASENVKIVQGDILDQDSILSALNGIDSVLHIAGLIKSRCSDELYRVNRVGASNVASAVKQSGINNIVYLSSLAARGPLENQQPVSHYGYSKRFGELEFFKYLYDKNLKILRPPIIYGPYEREFFTLFKLAKLGVMPVLEDRYCSFIYIYDLIIAIEGLLKMDACKPKVYHISDGGNYSWDDVADLMFKTVEKSGFKLKMNHNRAKFVAYLTYFLKDKAPFTFDKIREIQVKSWVCDYYELNNDTGFLPKYTLIDGLKRTFEWYVKNRWL